MDLDGDGAIDVLSGSYSRQDRDMAGLFQVLRGGKDGTWAKATVVNDSDGAPLILPRGDGDDDVIDRICTRPFACDLDGDGKLDLVVGNFRGTFGVFRGEGGGKFAANATWLERNGERLQVDGHGDPFVVDIDGDGDLDLVSGSAQGGVFLFANVGDRTKVVWGERQTLLAPAGHGITEPDAVKFGDAHVVAPGSDTRVWAADVDGDGKLDLLVGDRVTLLHVGKGVSEADARQKFLAWSKKQAEFFQQPQAETEDGMKKWQQDYQALEKEREAFATEDMTGFVWLLRGK